MKLLAGVSGGADSVALLHYLIEEGHEVVAAHCNFHLRGEESDRDEKFVRGLCATLGVPLVVGHFDTASYARDHGISIEMAARRQRYGWFERQRGECGAERICVAHHAGDRAETLLLNLTRGTGIRGLGAMHSEQGRVWRPLLEWTREDVRRYLAARGLCFVEDSTNADTRYRRNKIRHEVLPLLSEINPGIIRTLSATARRLEAQTALYDYAVESLRARFCDPLPGGGLRISLRVLADAPSPETLLHEWLSPYGFSAADIPSRTGGVCERRGRLLTRTGPAVEVADRPETLSPVNLPDEGCAALPGGRKLGVTRARFRGMDSIPRRPDAAVLDAATLDGPLFVRSVAGGDSFVPLGMRGRKLVSDYLTDRHVSRLDKLRALAVCDAAGIVWLVGHTVAERCRVRPSTAGTVSLEISGPGA